jgi:hypothetical protein
MLNLQRLFLQLTGKKRLISLFNLFKKMRTLSLDQCNGKSRYIDETLLYCPWWSHRAFKTNKSTCPVYEAHDSHLDKTQEVREKKKEKRRGSCLWMSGSELCMEPDNILTISPFFKRDHGSSTSPDFCFLFLKLYTYIKKRNVTCEHTVGLNHKNVKVLIAH